MREFQKYARNWIFMMAFWATCKIAQPIQPIWQHIFALPWSALKKPPWEFNFFHIFRIPSSSRHEKRCQMLQTLFCLFQCSKNPQCIVSNVLKFAIFCHKPRTPCTAMMSKKNFYVMIPHMGIFIFNKIPGLKKYVLKRHKPWVKDLQESVVIALLCPCLLWMGKPAMRIWQELQ